MKYKIIDKEGNDFAGEIIRRTGKATGKFRDFWEVKNLETSIVKEFDMKNQIESWKKLETNEFDEYESAVADSSIGIVFVVEKDVEERRNKDITLAKNVEYERWLEENVFDEIDDIGQERLSTTWVITDKSKEDKIRIKARLVVRGFEEQNRSARSDSPTSSKEFIRLALAIASAHTWSLHSLDVKAAFLQGKQVH